MKNCYIINMDIVKKYNIDDEIIKVYLKAYLNAIESKKPQKYLDLIQNRMLFLIKRKRA